MSETAAAFASLPLDPRLLQALDSLDYRQMTPIQAAALPAMLAGRDVIGQARTGSGKTAAYGLAVLSRIDLALPATQALVLCPTRELAEQIAGELRRLARCLPNVRITVLGGGIVKRPQVAALAHDPHIVVGITGRVQELIDDGHLKLGALRVLVLDEADRMLDGDFEAASRAIVSATPAARQTLCFSATFPDAVRKLSQRLQREPEIIKVDVEAPAAPDRAGLPRGRRRAPRRCAGASAQHATAGVGAGLRAHQGRCPGTGEAAAEARLFGCWRCTATATRASATRCWCASSTARPGCWSPPMSPPAASTSRSCRW